MNLVFRVNKGIVLPQVSSAYATKQRAQRLARIGIIAALYAALTLAALLFLGGLAWGPVQFRISEAVVVIALFTADAIPGLTLGCVIANLANMVISGTGALGLLDVVFGSLATALGAWFTWKNRKNVQMPLLCLHIFPFCFKDWDFTQFHLPPLNLMDRILLCSCLVLSPQDSERLLFSMY